MEVEKLKAIMKQKGISQIDLAALSGVPLNTIRNIFCGRTPHPRIDTMRAIKQALGIDEKPTLAQQVLDTTLANLDIDDFNNLTPTEQQQVIAVFNSVVSTFKQK